MHKFILVSLNKISNLYTFFGDNDKESTACYIFALISVSFINFLISVLYLNTGNELFRFNLYPMGVILLVLLILFTIVLHVKYLGEISKSSTSSYNSKIINFMNNLFLLFMTSTWVLAPILYKIGINIYG